MTRRYAEGTTVAAETSRGEIASLLTRRGANQVITGWDVEHGSFVQFRLPGRYARLAVPLPDKEKLGRLYPNAQRSTAELRAAEERRAWRALILLVKAKLEAIDSEVSTFEREFMADLLLPNGKTLAENVAPALEAAYSTGKMQPLLPAWDGAA